MRHVFSEARRVDDAVSALDSDRFERFGQLVNESHESCRTNCEISIPEVDALVQMCTEEGALGARVMGTGAEGCAAAFVRDKNLTDFISSIISRYYNGYLMNEGLDAQVSMVALEHAIFPCKPSAGAGVLLGDS
jgi:N-acetylgalactosamine kinase